MQEKNSRKKQNTRLFIVIGIAVVLVAVIQFYFYKNTNDVNTEITQVVEKYNKNCPLTIQEGIRLDSVSLHKDRTVQYNLTLTNVEEKTIDLDVVQPEIQKSIISTAKENSGLTVFRENDYVVVYSYNDKNKVYLFKVTMMPDQYK